jgi:hypothetical protein
MAPALGATGLARLAPGYRPGNREAWLKEAPYDDSPISIHDEASGAAALLSASNPVTGVAHSPVTAHRPGAERERNSAHHCRVVKRLTDRLESISAAVRLSTPRLVSGARENRDSQARPRSPDILSAVHAARPSSWPRSPDVVRDDGTADNKSSVRSRGCGR